MTEGDWFQVTAQSHFSTKVDPIEPHNLESLVTTLPMASSGVPRRLERKKTWKVFSRLQSALKERHKNSKWGWIDGPVMQTAYCSAREPKFSSSCPHWEAHNSLQEHPMPLASVRAYPYSWVHMCVLPHTLKNNKNECFKESFKVETKPSRTWILYLIYCSEVGGSI